MIVTTDTYISEIICHRFCIDNSHNILSSRNTSIEKADNFLLKNILLDVFVSHNEVYEFVHDIDIDLNVLRKIVKEFWDKEDLLNHKEEDHQSTDEYPPRRARNKRP